MSAAPPASERRSWLKDINPTVFFGTAIFIVAISIWASVDTENAEGVIGAVVGWVSTNLGWYYFLIVTAVVVFVLYVSVTKIGATKLGPDHSKPEFSMFTWASMLFAAGIGIDLMFFSVSEPISQYLAPPQGDGGTVEAARQALVWTLFHYGITGWALYALMGLALGYFAYRHNLPLSIRSALYPIFGKRINGKLGDVVDIAAMLGTVFGIATSLGIGVVQLNYGFTYMFGWAEGLPVQIGLIVAAVAMATISVVSGVKKGIRRLSELNVILAIALMLFVLVTGPTNFLFDGIVQNVGDFVSRFPALTLDTMAYDRPDDWMNAWTLFFWAWWVAWAPFVGLFLARISRGRTIRQFVVGVMVVPFAFILLWISIFGNGALDIVMGGNAAFGETAMNLPERAFYSMLDQYPLAPVSAAIATFTGLLFYVTSADSGALVMAKFTSRPGPHDHDGAKWLRIFWAVATGVLTLAMLSVGGITTLQNATIVMGLPLSVLLVFIMLGVFKALRLERTRAESFTASIPLMMGGRGGAGAERGRSWRQRLARMMSFPGQKQTARYVTTVVEPALREVAQELAERGADAELRSSPVESCGIPQVELTVHLAPERDFQYQVYPVSYPAPSYTMRDSDVADDYFTLEVFSVEGSHGYDVAGFTKEQLIADVLDQYERHLTFLHLNRKAPGQSVIVEDPPAHADWEADFANDEEK
ncbi:BCCT family transporter [Mycetocola reblochoni]|uniref:High-affinity choline uptake protein BetT n=2 Tax=Mycetocola reblochoni TaxID=331618 RepID=A0A1R4IEJ2_9MICO|nr:choline BCCT transporter BetT [Mycetocola reblochoni]RLP69104.1 BCCT family transporter [Mycetocola reblochoni]SJN17733.1 High-affinity choline uptake protein BetT [Mycetocola reblochoni REB411]